MERGEAVGMELTPVETFSSSYSSSSSLPSEEGAPAIVKVTWGSPSTGKETPPVTPQLSIASSHGAFATAAAAAAAITTSSSTNSISSRSDMNSGNAGRARSRRKNLPVARHGSDDSIYDGDDDNEHADEEGLELEELKERYAGRSPPPPPSSFPSSLSSSSSMHRRGDPAFFSPSWHYDNGYDMGRKKKKPRPASPLLLPSLAKKTKPPPKNDHRCCCYFRPRCLLALGLCLATGCAAFKIVWWILWLARCTEGCYDPAAAKTGSLGPEQVHLAYGGVDAQGNPTGMSVVWTTSAGEAPPVVEYGPSENELSLTARGTSVRYLDTVHHRATLEGLAPGTRFFYRCGNPSSANATAASGDDEAKGEGEGKHASPPGAGNPPTLAVAAGTSSGGGRGEGDDDNGADSSTGGKGEEGAREGSSSGDEGGAETEAEAEAAAAAEEVVGGGGGGEGFVGLDPLGSDRGYSGGTTGGGGAHAVAAEVPTTRVKGGAHARDGEGGKWSTVSSFVTAPEAERWAGDGPWDRPVSVAVVGDLGLANAGATFDRLHQLVADNEVDFVFHLGDIGYADDAFLERPWSFGYEDKWDAFMRRASHNFASKAPYMVVPGNHEAECHSPACLASPRRLNALGNFAAFNARFRMPSAESGAEHGASMWYSFNVGPVHFVVVDTETDFPGAGGDHLGYPAFERGNGGFGDQVAWLEEDLALADQEREVRPWIIVAGHRPMYSTEYADSDGLTSRGHSNRIRHAFEPIFARNKVDLYLSGHVHAFERSWPVLDNVPFFRGGGGGDGGETASGEGFGGGGGSGGHSAAAGAVSSSKMVYQDPVAPVHVVNGAGGCLEGFTVPAPVYPASFPKWRAVGLNMVPGVGILTFPSKAEMRSTFVTSDSPMEVLDELMIKHRRPPLE